MVLQRSSGILQNLKHQRNNKTDLGSALRDPGTNHHHMTILGQPVVHMLYCWVIIVFQSHEREREREGVLISLPYV